MPEAGPHSVRTRRAASIWTKIHPLFAIGQLFAFLASVGLLVAYFRGAVPFPIVHISVMVKIGLMIGAVVTGSLWEHDVFGWWWFAPEFLAEDVMTLIVFIFQVSYILMTWLHPHEMRPILTILCLAYSVYVANVAQYIHKTQQMKKPPAAPALPQAA